MPSNDRRAISNGLPPINKHSDLSSMEQKQRTRSTSLSENATRLENQITLMQTRNAADEALLARIKQASEENRIAMDGYKANVICTC